MLGAYNNLSNKLQGRYRKYTAREFDQKCILFTKFCSEKYKQGTIHHYSQNYNFENEIQWEQLKLNIITELLKDLHFHPECWLMVAQRLCQRQVMYIRTFIQKLKMYWLNTSISTVIPILQKSNWLQKIFSIKMFQQACTV